MKNRVQAALSVSAAVLLMWGVITETVTAQPGRGGSGNTNTTTSGGGRGTMGGGPGGMMGGGRGTMGGGPGGTTGGGPGGGGQGGLAQVLRTMDANGDGVLTMNEVPEQRRPFVTMIVQRMGRDPNQPIDLNALAASGSTPTATQATRGTAAAGGGGGGRSRGTTAAPLVAPFGERTTTTAGTPPIFGQATPVAAVVSTAAAGTASSSLNPTERNARDILDKHDKNRNGYLDKDKQEWNRTLPFDADRADKNRDGRLSMAEIVTVLGGKLSASSGAMVTSFRPSEAYERLPAGVPDWFLQRDTDRDGQITMPEYIAGQPWSMGVAAEFEFLDLSSDGIVTLTETFAVLQRIDEEKARKADAERRENERLRGGLAAMAPPQTAPSGTPNPGAPVDPNTPPSSPPGAAPTASSTPPVPPQPAPNAPYATGSAPTSTSPRGGSPQQRDPRGDRGARGGAGGNAGSGGDNRRSYQPR